MYPSTFWCRKKRHCEESRINFPGNYSPYKVSMITLGC